MHMKILLIYVSNLVTRLLIVPYPAGYPTKPRVVYFPNKFDFFPQTYFQLPNSYIPNVLHKFVKLKIQFAQLSFHLHGSGEGGGGSKRLKNIYIYTAFFT